MKLILTTSNSNAIDTIELEGNALTTEIYLEDLNAYIREFAQDNGVTESSVSYEVLPDALLWFCTPDAESSKGKIGYRFYLSTKKDYASDIELSPAPWVHAESLETENNFFFTSRDQSFPGITKELLKLGVNI